MGAWGYGLLQNDEAQDGLLEELDKIENSIAGLVDRKPSEKCAARLAAGIGLLLHQQVWHCFREDQPFLETLYAAIDRHEPAFGALPKAAVELLRAIRQGKGAELAEREEELPAPLGQAFYAQSEGFPMERKMGVREDCLFEHPASAEYVQQFADSLVKRIARGFRDEDSISDPAREAGAAIAPLCILLAIEPCKVDGELFREWWNLFRKASAEVGTDPDEEEFHTAYRNNLRMALEAGLNRFSTGKPAPLEA